MILMQMCSIWHKKRCILVCVQSAARPHLWQHLEHSTDKNINIIENNLTISSSWTNEVSKPYIQNHHAKGLT